MHATVLKLFTFDHVMIDLFIWKNLLIVLFVIESKILFDFDYYNSAATPKP